MSRQLWTLIHTILTSEEHRDSSCGLLGSQTAPAGEWARDEEATSPSWVQNPERCTGQRQEDQSAVTDRFNKTKHFIILSLQHIFYTMWTQEHIGTRRCLPLLFQLDYNDVTLSGVDSVGLLRLWRLIMADPEEISRLQEGKVLCECRWTHKKEDPLGMKTDGSEIKKHGKVTWNQGMTVVMKL